MSEAERLLKLAAWIRTPGNINPDDAVDECARPLENNAAALSGAPAEDVAAEEIYGAIVADIRDAAIAAGWDGTTQMEVWVRAALLRATEGKD